MTEAMRSPPPGRELAARGRDGRAAARLEASGPLSRCEAHARRGAAKRPCGGRKQPRRARSRMRTREIMASVILSAKRFEQARKRLFERFQAAPHHPERSITLADVVRYRPDFDSWNPGELARA